MCPNNAKDGTRRFWLGRRLLWTAIEIEGPKAPLRVGNSAYH
jgi:hypothetical protein